MDWPKSLFRFFCNILWENIIELFDQPINRSERLIQIIDATVVQLRNEQLRVGQDLSGLENESAEGISDGETGVVI